MCSKYFQYLKKAVGAQSTKFSFAGGNLKQVYMVRTDLEMGKGKIAAQCCHAAVKAYSALQNSGKEACDALEKWEWEGSRKVVVKVSSEEELVDMIKKAKAKGLYATSIRDAGKTQIAAGSMTVGVIGPANQDAIDEISGHLKLL
jgi:PTH2 family peptidyl-tRNA hydrolase